ncbi:MAG: Dabb family protein [Capsulimonas sp.]|uniref:Dabb family protein n=1 Tax=Capsulimonas sp. TaxID=2494211 RepID=UPI00326544D3
MTHHSGFFHHVYFWLREGGGPDDARELAEGCRTHLSHIPGVQSITVATPAGTPRAVVDNTYAVALLMEFADQAAHDGYQEHPDHLRFITECKHLWSRVQIYDAVPAEA